MNRCISLVMSIALGVVLGAAFSRQPAAASSSTLYGTVADANWKGVTPLTVELRDPRTNELVARRKTEATIADGRYLADLGEGIPDGLYVLHMATPAGVPLQAATFVELQANSPGTKQTGNANISGTLLAGKIGVPSVNSGAMINALGTGGIIGVRGQSDGTGVLGSTTSAAGAGVSGNATLATGSSSGVIGFNSSPSGFGVRGNGGPGIGVRGQTNSTTLPGVFGTGPALGGSFLSSDPVSLALRGEATGNGGRGVFGKGDTGVEGEGATFGVRGRSPSIGGQFAATGVEGIGAQATSSAQFGTAVDARSNGPDSTGIFAEGAKRGGNFATFGDGSTAVNGDARGNGLVFGGDFQSNSTEGRGVRGTASAVSGATFGGWFTSLSPTGVGAIGTVNSATGTTIGLRGTVNSVSGKGVVGESTATTGTNFGGDFVNNSANGAALRARNTATTNFGRAAEFTASAPSGTAVQATAASTTGNPVAIQALTSASGASGILINCSAATGTTIGAKAQLASADGKPFVAQNLALDTTVEVGGKSGAVMYDKGHITKQFGATLFSMSPIAYGTVNSGGTKAGGTTNWSVAFDNTSKIYTITLNQDNLVQSNFVCHFTPITNDLGTFHNIPAMLFDNANPNQIKVNFHNINGFASSTSFMFVVYGQVPVITVPPQGP